MKSYTLDDFDSVPSSKEVVTAKVLVGELPDIETVKALATWTEEMVERFNRERSWFTPETGDRSSAMGAFAYLGAEKNWTDEQIMAALYDMDNRWGKYVERRDRDKRLIDFLNRARQKIGYMPVIDIDLSRFLKSPEPAVAGEPESKMVYGAQEFVDMEFKIEWLLEGLLSQGGFGFITGYPGTGKTQFCLQLASYLALGTDKFLKWDNVASSKKVLFLSLEMGKSPLNLFMGQIIKAYPDRKTLNKNLLLAPFGVPIPLDTKDGQAFLNNLLDEYMPDIIVIDSLQKVISKELTDELAVKALVHYLSMVREKYKTSMLVVHHNRKKANDGQKKMVELSDVYGSTYLTTDVDFVLSLKKLNPNLLGVDMLKNRLGPDIDPFEISRDANLHFELDMVNLSTQFGKKEGLDV